MISSFDLDIGEGSWSEDELVESSEEGSHESVGLGDVDFSGVVEVEFGPGSWEEFSHVCLHLGLGNLLGDEEDLGATLLGTILVKDFLSSLLTGLVGNLNGVMVEDVVHDIILISTEVSGSWGISGGWWWVFLLLLSELDGHNWGLLNSEEGGKDKNACEFHFYLLIYYLFIIFSHALYYNSRAELFNEFK